MAKKKGEKNGKKLNEYTIDYNPDDFEDFEIGEEFSAKKGKNLKEVENERDLNPDDFEDFKKK
ncbi:hypothetical protein [Halonatronum saccharophilum]|uniref:hypothetical protein n=1 Tax=Halonatronum saccharophilum TaxID=150060 RepID=UPI000481AB31|nr:hypothetical protein [Halonatronum saccharophilum]